MAGMEHYTIVIFIVLLGPSVWVLCIESYNDTVMTGIRGGTSKQKEILGHEQHGFFASVFLVRQRYVHLHRAAAARSLLVWLVQQWIRSLTDWFLSM